MDYFAAEIKQEFHAALADQARARWRALINARIKAFREHARRSEGQKFRWLMHDVRVRERIARQLFERQLRLALYGKEDA
jgi:hypothetical protein